MYIITTKSASAQKFWSTSLDLDILRVGGAAPVVLAQAEAALTAGNDQMSAGAPRRVWCQYVGGLDLLSMVSGIRHLRTGVAVGKNYLKTLTH